MHAFTQVIEGQYYIAPISAFWLFSASAASELPRALQSGAWEIVLANPAYFALSASLGFCVHIATFLVIKAT